MRKSLNLRFQDTEVDVPFGFKLDRNTAYQLKERAISEGRTVSSVIRIAIRYWLNSQEVKQS